MSELFSKKYRTTILAVVTVLAEQWAEQPWYVVVTTGVAFVGYIVAQGFADAGKEKAKVLLDAADQGQDLAREAIAQAVREELASMKLGGDKS